LPLSLGRYKAIEEGEGVIILSRKAYPSKVADSWDATKTKQAVSNRGGHCVMLKVLKEGLRLLGDPECFGLDKGSISTHWSASDAEALGSSESESGICEGLLVEVNEEAFVGLKDDTEAVESKKVGVESAGESQAVRGPDEGDVIGDSDDIDL